MIPDFLCRKIKCFYCNNKIKRKDATVLSIIVNGELQEQHPICLSCATMIKGIKKEIDEKNYLSQFSKPKWAVQQIIRYDRGNLVEDICKHGIGHPNKQWYLLYGKDGDTIHGCDGCCQESDADKIANDKEIEIVMKEEKKKSPKKTSKKTTKKKKKDKIYSAEPLKIVKL